METTILSRVLLKRVDGVTYLSRSKKNLLGFVSEGSGRSITCVASLDADGGNFMVTQGEQVNMSTSIRLGRKTYQTVSPLGQWT